MGKLDKQVRAMPEAGFLPLEENRVQEEVINKGTGQWLVGRAVEDILQGEVAEITFRCIERQAGPVPSEPAGQEGRLLWPFGDCG